MHIPEIFASLCDCLQKTFRHPQRTQTTKKDILSRLVFTNILDALGTNAGMYNYQSKLLTFVESGKKKAVTTAYKNSTNFS